MPMMIPEILRGHAAIHGIRVGSLANLAVRYLIGGSSVRFPQNKNPGTRPGFLLPSPDSHFARDPDDTLPTVSALVFLFLNGDRHRSLLSGRSVWVDRAAILEKRHHARQRPSDAALPSRPRSVANTSYAYGTSCITDAGTPAHCRA